LRREFGAALDAYEPVMRELIASGLLVRRQDNLQLTPRGRLLSNEVFERFILTPATA
jgi:coproporphyrinogen III oxidase-like Fe-S oxidoreductase